MVGVGWEQRYIEGKYVTIAGGGDGIRRCLQDTYTKVLVIGHYFCSYFSSISDPTSLHIPYPTFLPYDYLCYVLFSLCPHTHDRQQEHIRLVLLVTEQLIYWATDIPKQSCCGSSSTRSCAGTSSAATERSHHSKFRTSRTRSMSRSVSTA